MNVRCVIAAVFGALLAALLPAHAQFDAGGTSPYSPVCPGGDISGDWPSCVVNTTGGATIASKNSTGQTSSMVGVAPSTIWVPTANVIINSTADTSCFSATGVGFGQTVTPSAGVPYVGNTFWMVCEGVFTTPAIGTVGVLSKVKWGAATVASATSSGLQTSASNNLQWALQARCTLRTISATPSSSTVMCWGTFSYAQAATGSQLVVTNFQSASPVSVDTTAAFKIDLTMALASSLGTENLTSVGGSVEIKF